MDVRPVVIPDVEERAVVSLALEVGVVSARALDALADEFGIPFDDADVGV